MVYYLSVSRKEQNYSIKLFYQLANSENFASKNDLKFIEFIGLDVSRCAEKIMFIDVDLQSSLMLPEGYKDELSGFLWWV
jgi:hypothetical protein